MVVLVLWASLAQMARLFLARLSSLVMVLGLDQQTLDLAFDNEHIDHVGLSFDP